MKIVQTLVICLLGALAALSAKADVGWSEGDDVTIASGATVALTASTPRLRSLTVAGTLTLANWDTCVKADTVTVASGGVIKPVAAFTDSEMSNRVWIVCDNLTVAAGGKINADQLGYKRGCGPSWAGVATSKSAGGGYGGKPGKGSAKTYGSALYPADPGSGGYPYDTSKTCTLAGGGAIRLEVSGALLVEGTITAVGSDPQGTIYTGGGMGSGGGIWITCNTIDGGGEVLAHGMLTESSGESTYIFGGGGGGRIAVHYNSSAQATKDATCHVRFDARGGAAVVSNGIDLNKNYPAAIGGLGSLYFTDSRFLTASGYRQHGWRFAGQWTAPGAVPSSVSVSGDFLLDNCALKIPITTFSVGGNLMVSGTFARTQMFELTNATVTVGGNCTVAGGGFLVYGGSMSVGGDLTVTPQTGKSSKCYSGEFHLAASPTNGTLRAVGVTLDVKGAMKMSGHSLCRLFCHATDGAIPELKVNSLDVSANGWISADNGGWNSLGFGSEPGKGAAHGGIGAGYQTANAKVYGDEMNPVYPGSGCVTKNGEQPGGGVVKLIAESAMRVNGKISANAIQTSSNWLHGGSGGSVWLKCYKLLASSGNITANGADGATSALRGGGGRIALTYYSGSTNGLVFTVAKGAGSDYTYMKPWVDASSGTVHVNKRHGRMMIIIR